MSDLETRIAYLDGQMHQLTARLRSTEDTANENARVIVRVDSEHSSTKEILLRHSKTHETNYSEFTRSFANSLTTLDNKLSGEILGIKTLLDSQQEFINKSIGRDGVVRVIIGLVLGSVVTGLVGIAIVKIYGS